MKKIVLIGSGAYGIRGLEYFKKENVFAFCDNACKENGYKYGVRYITYEKLLKIHKSYVLLISMNENNSQEVARQLLGYGITDFVILNKNMIDLMAKHSPEALLNLLNNDLERLKLETQQYIEMNKNLESQIQYLKSVSDIKLLRKANGYLSYIQEDTIRVVKKIFEEIKDLRIKPFLIAGSLLGYYRHNGFIPWDDDVDFGLFRDDYLRLIEYGKNSFIYLEIKASYDREDDLNIKEILKKHPNEFLMLVSPNCTQICLGPSEIEMRKIDFFVYDFFKNDFSFTRHKKVILRYADMRYTERGNAHLIEAITKEDATCKESDHVYFGLDNMDSYIYEKEYWIPRDIFLPLRNAVFEGIECFVPNNVLKALQLFYSDFESYPKELTCRHLAEHNLKLKNEYTYVGIIASCPEFVEESLELYQFLRTSGIYCVYMIDNTIKKNPGLHEKVNSKLMNTRVEFVCNPDEKIDILITDTADSVQMLTTDTVINFKEIKQLKDGELLKLFDKTGCEKDA